MKSTSGCVNHTAFIPNTIGKKIIGEIAELDNQFAIIKNGNVDSFYKKLEKAVEILIENYNLAK